MTRTYNRVWITVILAIFFVYYSLILYRAPFLLHDPDTFSHVKTGQWILDNAKFPTVDFYSYTALGKPWISEEWLSEIIFAAAFKIGGWRGVTIPAAIACAATIALLCSYLLQHLRFSIAIGWTVITETFTSVHFLARPHVFSFILIAAWMISLLDAYDDDNFNLPSLRTLAPLMIIWANLHGSFTFGLALLYVFAGFCIYQSSVQRNYTKIRQLLLTVCIVTASSFITPYGPYPAFMTIELLKLKFASSEIGELRPPDFQHYIFMLIYFIVVLSAIAGFGVRLRGPRLVIFALITFMGLSYLRGLVIFFLLIPIILARPAAECAHYFARQPDGHEATDAVLRFLQKQSIALIAVCMALTALITVSTWRRDDIVAPGSIAPSAAIDFVKTSNITGNVFNDYDFGGYLIFVGIPTFVDGREPPFSDEFLHKYFEAEKLTNIKSTFEMLDEYNVNWIIFPPKSPLAQALLQSSVWDAVYSDEDAIVFLRHR